MLQKLSGVVAQVGNCRLWTRITRVA